MIVSVYATALNGVWDTSISHVRFVYNSSFTDTLKYYFINMRNIILLM
jgi:hypothetical protein